MLAYTILKMHNCTNCLPFAGYEMSVVFIDADAAVNAGRSYGSSVSEIDNSAIGITMNNGEARVNSGLQDTGSDASGKSFTEGIPTARADRQTFDSSQSGGPNLAPSDEDKEQPSEMVFTVVAVDNNISELIQSSFNEVSLSKGVQLSLIPTATENITSTINADEVQLTATQNSGSFNQLALITSTLQQSSQGEESQQFLGQERDGVKSSTFDVASLQALNEDHHINKAENKIDGDLQKKPRVSCSICDQDFSDLPSMRRHCLIHSEEKPFQCEFCVKAFRRKDNLREHRNIHTLENVYSCTHCGKTFPRKYTHKVHMARYCTKEKLCSDSGKDEVVAWGQLDTATKITHTSPTNKASSTKTSVSNNKSSDPCHICHKTFRDSSTLKRHLLTHSDERPFKCRQCNKSFRRKDHLQEHVIVHNEVRPFPCPQCGRSFSRKNGLKTHMIRTSHVPGSTHSPSKATMLSDNEELTEDQENSHEFQEMLTSNQVFPRNSNAKNQGDVAKVTEQQSEDLVQTNVEMKINEEVNISVNLDISEVNMNLNSQNSGGTSRMNGGTMNGLTKQSETSVVLSSNDVETLNVDENSGSVSRNKEENVFKKSSTVLSDSQNEKGPEVQEIQTGKNGEDIQRCPSCPDVFLGKDQLWDHFQAHLTNDMLACEHCLATFTETEVFQEHQKKCVAAINKDTEDTLSLHGLTECAGSESEDVVSGDTYLEDELCQGSSNDNPVDTTDEDLTGKGLRVCPICNKQFRDTTALRRHSLVHSGERPHACKQCDKRFRRRDHLKSHMTAYHCGTTTFNCNICEMVFTTRYSLSIHSKSCKKAVTRPQTMAVDTTKTTNATKVDDVPESKSCPVCHKTFKDPSTQRRHLRIHSEERPFQCDVCPKSFRRKDNLKEHMLCHSDQKPFACEDCGKALSRRSSLTNHRGICPMRRIDTTAITIKNTTNMPEMDFVEPSTTTEDREMCVDNNTQELNDTPVEPMEEDIQDGGGDGNHGDDEEDHHNGSDDGGDDKSFSCNQCGKAFRAKWTLKYHQRVHTGEKPYTCLTCDRQFRQPSHLKIHERTHSGERPYVCEACGRAFIDSSTMRRHARLHKDAAGAIDPDEAIHDDSVGSGGTGVHHSEGIPVERDCIPMAVSSSDGNVKSSQPISTNMLRLVDVGEMSLSSKIETLSDMNWQQNPQENLEEHMVYLFPTAKETNKEQCPNNSENISF